MFYIILGISYVVSCIIWAMICVKMNKKNNMGIVSLYLNFIVDALLMPLSMLKTYLQIPD